MLFWITFGQLAHTKCTNAQMHKSLFSCDVCTKKRAKCLLMSSLLTTFAASNTK